MDTYGVLKLVHILGATLLFGTGLGTAFFMYRADGSGDVNAIAMVSRNVVLADCLFTAPAVLIQPVTGYLLMRHVGYGWSETWIVTSVALYLLAGACWLPVVWLQIRIRDLAKQAAVEGTPLPPRYRAYMKAWIGLKWPAFIAVIAIFFLMVFKPA